MKNTEERRHFIKQATILTSMAFIPFYQAGCASPTSNRKFRISLNPGAVGVNLGQEELLDAAIKYGFEAIIPYSSTLIEWNTDQFQAFLDKMKKNKISWGASGLPMDFRRDEDTYAKGLNDLPKHAAALQKAGITRMSTWIMPTHAELTYMQNFNQHATRLKEVCKILGDHDIKFGLEYVGPKTLMASQKFSFVHTMAECLELIAAIDEPNTGFQLDSFHWYCAGETKEDLLKLKNEQIITCDLNDGRAGFSADQQIDQQRELPMATGVVDMKSFMEALIEIGYDGPIRAEPFNKVLNDMENDEALNTTIIAMKKATALVE